MSETAFRALVNGVTLAKPCVVTTVAAHGFQTGQMVRFTDLGSSMPTARGMDELDGNRYKIVVLTTTTFALKEPVTDEDLDSSAYTAWISGGRINVETRTLNLNNPQQRPYTEAVPYDSNPFFYEA